MTPDTKLALVNRRSFLESTAVWAVTSLASRGSAAGTSETLKADVCVYGGVSGGVIAAVALAQLGRSVVLVEPTRHLGGMTSGGLGWIDIARGEAPVGGLAHGSSG